MNYTVRKNVRTFEQSFYKDVDVCNEVALIIPYICFVKNATN